MRYTGTFWVKTDKPKYSIANTMPNYLHMETIEELVPSWKLVKAYKDKEITKEEYEYIYSRQLDELGKARILELIPDESVVCCWEKIGFCHRHILADYIGKEVMAELESSEHKKITSIGSIMRGHPNHNEDAFKEALRVINEDTGIRK